MTAMISVFDLFSIGIGPSSSHTVGPMRAARAFVSQIDCPDRIHHLQVTVYGSLAFTGHGHGTDHAILLGLEGADPQTVDPETIPSRIARIHNQHQIMITKNHTVPFNPSEDLIFNYKDQFDFHTNAMRFSALDRNKAVIQETVYFSIGGGFIVCENDILSDSMPTADDTTCPLPFRSAAELLHLCHEQQLTISQLMMTNEKTWRDEPSIRSQLIEIADIMEACIDRGLRTTGTLPGKLGVKRRASSIYESLRHQGPPRPNHPDTMNWLNVFAMAVNEENAAGGRVVTAPTNGAAGILPATLNYLKYLQPQKPTEDTIIDFLLTAAAIGILYKRNASISGAEMGCQGEVGVACSMAAGGLVAALGGTLSQIENAAEIAMEHNLGLTCDPVAGLVQIPCIERNAMATVKAVNAAHLALAESGRNKISLDMVIQTMKEIGVDMHSKYKETSLGGLAKLIGISVNKPEC